MLSRLILLLMRLFINRVLLVFKDVGFIDLGVVSLLALTRIFVLRIPWKLILLSDALFQGYSSGRF